MNVYEEQLQLRPANDAEHAEIEKQLMGWAKTLAISIVCVVVLGVVTIVLEFVEGQGKGAGTIKTIVIAVYLCFAVVFYGFLLKVMLEPVFRISKRQYLVVDCIVLEKEKRSSSRGTSYFAVVSFADGTSRRVRIDTSQIYEKAGIGHHAVVVWFLDRKGNPRKHPYSLSVV